MQAVSIGLDHIVSSLLKASQGRQEEHEFLVAVPTRLRTGLGAEQVFLTGGKGSGLHFEIYLGIAVRGFE